MISILNISETYENPIIKTPKNEIKLKEEFDKKTLNIYFTMDIILTFKVTARSITQS